MQKDLESKSRAIFKDRLDALNKLLEVMPLREIRERGNNILVAISTGGVILANGLAKKIDASFDFLFTEEITAPNNIDCQIGMVSETEEIVIHEALVKSFDIKLDYIYGEAKRKHEEKILKYVYKYRKGEMISSLTEKNVILIDEGIDTGLTMMAAVKTAIELKAKTVSFAVPVMPEDVSIRLDKVIDEIYCVYSPKDFVDVSFYYEELPEVLPVDVEDIFRDGILDGKNISRGIMHEKNSDRK